MSHFVEQKVKAVAFRDCRESYAIFWLEAERRAECNLQIILCTAVEVNVVTHIQTQTDWPPEALYSNTWINRRTGVTRSYASKRSLKTSKGAVIGGAEIDEADFERSERAKWAAIGLELGSKQRGQRPSVSSYKQRRCAVRKSRSEITLEVVGHLPFDLHIRIHVKSHAPAHANEVNVRVSAA